MHECKQVVDIIQLQVHEERIQSTAMDKKDKYRSFQNLTVTVVTSRKFPI